jgi:hypothetical protein
MCEYYNKWILGNFCKDNNCFLKIYSILLQVFTEICRSLFNIGYISLFFSCIFSKCVILLWRGRKVHNICPLCFLEFYFNSVKKLHLLIVLISFVPDYFKAENNIFNVFRKRIL